MELSLTISELALLVIVGCQVFFVAKALAATDILAIILGVVAAVLVVLVTRGVK